MLVRALAVSIWFHLLAVSAMLFPLLQNRNKSTAAPAGESLTIISLPLIIPPNKFDSPFVELLTSSVYRQFMLRNIRPINGE